MASEEVEIEQKFYFPTDELNDRLDSYMNGSSFSLDPWNLHSEHLNFVCYFDKHGFQSRQKIDMREVKMRVKQRYDAEGQEQVLEYDSRDMPIGDLGMVYDESIKEIAFKQVRNELLRNILHRKSKTTIFKRYLIHMQWQMLRVQSLSTRREKKENTT
jgi:hypothetical protein